VGTTRGWLRLAAGLGSVALLCLVASGPITPPPGAQAFATRSPDCISHDCASVKIDFGGGGSGAVVLVSPGNETVDCTDTADVASGTCHYVFTWPYGAAGTEVQMTATPAAGSVFCPSSGPCDAEGMAGMTNYSIGPGGDLTIGVDFDLVVRYLTVTIAGSGSGTVTSDPPTVMCPTTCASIWTFGTRLTLNAQPRSGSYFAGWADGCSGTGPCEVKLTTDLTVEARFALNAPATPPPGQVTPTPSVIAAPSGSSLAIPTASPVVTPTPAPAPSAADTGVPVGIVVLLVVLAVACGGLLVAVVALLRRSRT